MALPAASLPRATYLATLHRLAGGTLAVATVFPTAFAQPTRQRKAADGGHQKKGNTDNSEFHDRFFLDAPKEPGRRRSA